MNASPPMASRWLDLTIALILLLLPATAYAWSALEARTLADGRSFVRYLPLIRGDGVQMAEIGARYEAIPVIPPSTDRPAEEHADLNLALRSFGAVVASSELIEYGGPTDMEAPRMAGLFAGRRIPTIVSTHQVHDWNWDCGRDGCRGSLLQSPAVTLVGLAVTPGEYISIPSRNAQILDGGYIALVLYADAHRITLKYTREDNVVRGYAVHLESLCVDRTLLDLYESANAAGRGALPALLNNQPLGRACFDELRVAVRDNGAFMDPRSRKDWW